MTYNLLALNRSPDGVLGSIVAARADVVAVQELTVPMAAAIAAGLRETHPNQAVHPAGVAGAGVFSRYPIAREQTLRLSDVGNVCQHLLMATPRGRFHLFNIHLNAPRLHLKSFRYDHGLRELEAANLLEEIARASGPVVVCGDCNMTVRSETYRLITNVLADAARGRAGPSRTFPNPGCHRFAGVPRWLLPFPVIRIDYIFHSRDIACLNAQRGAGDGSDHYPVIARLRF